MPYNVENMVTDKQVLDDFKFYLSRRTEEEIKVFWRLMHTPRIVDAVKSALEKPVQR